MSEVTTEDTRSFVERIFFNIVNGKNVLKKVFPVDCSNGEPKSLPKDRVCLLRNYKMNIERGRKDRLQGKDVLAFPSDKGFIYLPLDEALEAAQFFHSYVSSLQNAINRAKADQ